MERELILACVLCQTITRAVKRDVMVLDVRMNVFVIDRAAPWFGKTGDGSFLFVRGEGSCKTLQNDYKGELTHHKIVI